MISKNMVSVKSVNYVFVWTIYNIQNPVKRKDRDPPLASRIVLACQSIYLLSYHQTVIIRFSLRATPAILFISIFAYRRICWIKRIYSVPWWSGSRCVSVWWWCTGAADHIDGMWWLLPLATSRLAKMCHLQFKKYSVYLMLSNTLVTWWECFDFSGNHFAEQVCLIFQR